MPARSKIAWTACAERLAVVVPRERLHPAVREWAAQCSAREPWLVALSGGADSVALLLLLWAHWPERRARLRAAHFNHRLRGRAAQRDERFCAELCRALRVPLAVGRWDKPPRDASEAAARTARHAFFDREAKRRRAHALWLGHQQDDVAETMLMRLARGSGSSGLAAPRPVQRMLEGRVHLRPLLTLKKAEIGEALRRCGGIWREDATNAGREYLRSRVRQQVVPAWQAAMGERDAIAGAALARELIEEDDAALEAWVERLAPWGADGALNLRRLRGLPTAVVRRALHGWLLRHGRADRLSRQCVSALLAAVLQQRVTRHSVGSDAFAEVGRWWLRLVPVAQKKRVGFQRRIN